MSAWVRVGAALAAVVAAALLLKSVPSVLVLALFIAVVVYANSRMRRAVKQDPGAGTALLGLKREEIDPFGILGYPLSLFARASEATIDELVWGTWSGLDVRAFALSFRGPSLPGGPPQRSAFACAMTRIEADLPAAVVEPSTFMTRFERAPEAPTVSAGDPRFDPSFNLWSRDEAFVRELLASTQREWLLGLDPMHGVEVGGRIVVVYGPRPDRPDTVATLRVMHELLRRLPSEALAAHPPLEDGRTPS